MSEFLKLFTVFISAAAELVTGVPLGMALGLDPITAGITSLLGGLSAGFFIIALGGRLRTWIVDKFVKHKEGEEVKGRERWIYRMWERFGVTGLGIMAPLLTGVPLGAAIGIALGAPPKKLLLWISLGAVIWSVVFTIMGALGLEGFKLITGE